MLSFRVCSCFHRLLIENHVDRWRICRIKKHARFSPARNRKIWVIYSMCGGTKKKLTGSFFLIKKQIGSEFTHCSRWREQVKPTKKTFLFIIYVRENNLLVLLALFLFLLLPTIIKQQAHTEKKKRRRRGKITIYIYGKSHKWLIIVVAHTHTWRTLVHSMPKSNFDFTYKVRFLSAADFSKLLSC